MIAESKKVLQVDQSIPEHPIHSFPIPIPSCPYYHHIIISVVNFIYHNVMSYYDTLIHSHLFITVSSHDSYRFPDSLKTERTMCLCLWGEKKFFFIIAFIIRFIQCVSTEKKTLKQKNKTKEAVPTS